MRKMKVLAALVAVTLIVSLAACGGGEEQGGNSKSKLYIYNWGEYMSRESDTWDFYGIEYELSDVISDFEDTYPQYDVEYRMFEDNEMMYAQMQTVSYDVIIPSEYMIARLIREDKLQQLDIAKLPNVTEHMDPLLKEVNWTPDAEETAALFDYAVPYLYCTTGMIYNQEEIDMPSGTDPADVWAPLFDSANKNRIGMYNSMRESIGVGLNYLGYSMNTLDEAELAETLDLLIKQRQEVAPLLGIDELKDKYVSGELVAGVAWSGDHVVIQQRLQEAGLDPDMIQYILPQGSNISVDMMAIPASAENVQGAHDFINFMYETEVAVKNAVYVGYSSPHLAAIAELPQVVSENESYYPGAELIASLETYYSTPDIDQTYDDLWVQYLVH
ncbi:MAG TPA: ABC transporter substrate-binding protein [Clostridiaceae bacterium]|nr:ABC transporter substrate-binding protein [Clostridiaceae bacterium]